MRTVAQQIQGEQAGNKDAAGFLHIRIPRELRRQAKIRAANEEKSVADVVADALRKHLGEAA